MLLASCSTDIKFHKWPSGDYHSSFNIPDTGYCIPSISWCKEGELLVTTVPSLQSPIIVSVTETIQPYEMVDIGQLLAASFAKSVQKKIAFGAEKGRVFIYEFDNQRSIQELPRLPHDVKFIHYGAQDASIAAGCKNSQICLYNSSHSVAATFYVPNANSLTSMSCHPKLPYILGAASGEGIVVVWNSDSGNTIKLDKTHTGAVTDMSFSHNDDMVTVGLDRRFIGYDLRCKECIFCCNADEQLSAVDVMPSSNKIAVASTNGKLFCYDKRRIDYPVYTIVAHHPKAIGRIAFQNVPAHVKLNDTIDHPYNECSKSKETTMIYRSKIDSGNSPQLPPQTSASNIVPDLDLDWRFAMSDDLEGLQNMCIDSRGDAPNNIDHPNIRQSNNSSPQIQTSSSSIDHASGSRMTVAINVLNKCSSDPHQKENVGGVKGDAVASWINHLPIYTHNSGVESVDKDEDIMKLRRELQEVTKNTIEQLAELVNKEVVKVRMTVSRGFAQMEYKMNARWKEFHMLLTKLAGYDGSPNKDENDDINDEEEPSKEIDEQIIHGKATRIPKKSSKHSS